MNLNETIISSFFIHLILFLLMLAASSYTTGFSEGIPKVVSVDLAMEENKDQPAELRGHEDEQPTESSPPSKGEMSLPEKAVSAPPKETTKIPEPQKTAEPATEPAKIEKTEKPALQKEGFASMEAYYQFIILHKKIFGKQAGDRVNDLLREAFKVNKREFYGGKAMVNLKFGPDGKVTEVIVDSESPSLKAFLEEIGWGIIPAPATYFLGSDKVQIEFTVLEGYMSFNVNAL
jgi:hypothetical protein